MKLTRRVVVTGLGMVTPLGLSVHKSWENLLLCKSGVVQNATFDATAFPARICAPVSGYFPGDYFSSKEARKIDKFVQYAYVASKQAMTDSGLEINESNSHRVGVSIGSGIGGLAAIEKNHTALTSGGCRKVSPFFIPGSIINMSSGFISVRFNLQGPNMALVTACATGAHNIGQAARAIAYGDADAMLAGGAEMGITDLAVAGFSRFRALSTRNDTPEKASRPWDKDRDGFVLGDGAGVMMLEAYEHAHRRGARIYAELTGFGMSGDAYHMTTPSAKGGCLAIQNALSDAQINPEAVSYINAHATSTPIGDLSEVEAIKAAFGAHAYKVPISSTKSMTGHLLGAAGSVEAIFCVLALRDGVIPATINLDNPDEGCDLDFVPHQTRDCKHLQTVLSNSFGFGGTNATLVFKKISEAK